MSTSLAWPVVWLVALAISALGLVASVNSRRFARGVAREARALWSTAAAATSPRPTSVEELPAPVARYLRLAGADDGRPLIRSVRLTHRGTMTLSPGAAPIPVLGQQYFSADPPGFVWWGRVRLAPGVWIDARDRVIAGRAGMKVMLESTYPIQNAAGPELDHGALVRLLGEMTWLPTTFRDGRYVRWQAIDARRARASLSVEGSTVSADFEFGEDGMPEGFVARRYRDGGPGKPAALAPFVGRCLDWREVDGLRVPFKVEGSWIIDGQPYTFARFEVERLEVGRTEPF